MSLCCWYGHLVEERSICVQFLREGVRYCRLVENQALQRHWRPTSDVVSAPQKSLEDGKERKKV